MHSHNKDNKSVYDEIFAKSQTLLKEKMHYKIWLSANFFAKSACEYVLSTLDHFDTMNHNLLDSAMLHLYFGIPFYIDDLVV